jgi:hypothetical protein
MDAIIGRYRARMEETGLILRHAAGINFDLTLEETLGLLDFINTYRQTLLALCEHDTDPAMERISIEHGQQVKGIHSFND